jgi:Phycobilisome protein
MAGVSAGPRAAAALAENAEAVARSVTGLLYAEMPWLVDRYGERGRQKCLQDMRYHLEHLAPAVELEDPALFARYAEWCDGMLRARGVQTDELRRCLQLMEWDVAARLPDDQARVAAACLQAGIGALRGGGGG